MSEAPRNAPGARATLALRRLPAAGARLWLVRPDTLEATAALSLLLLHHLPGALVALGAEFQRHG